MGRILLVKALGISKIVYLASMLCVPEEVIKRVQEKLFSYLWRNKKDKIKRTVLYQTPCRGGLNFPDVRTTVKALRLSWIGRLLSESVTSCIVMACPSMPWGEAEINVASILFCCTFVLPQHGVRSDLTIFSELRNLDKSDDGVLVRTGSRSGHAPEVFDNGRPTKKL